jgi:hypothetical protein
MSGTGNAGTATFDDLVKESAKVYPSLFQTNRAAADTSQYVQRPNTGTKTISRKDFGALDAVERHQKIVKEGGIESSMSPKAQKSRQKLPCWQQDDYTH